MMSLGRKLSSVGFSLYRIIEKTQMINLNNDLRFDIKEENRS